VVTYSYIRNSDKKEFFAKPVSMVNANAPVKFEGDGLVFETTNYNNSANRVKQYSMWPSYAEVAGSSEKTGYFTMNLKPNAELKKQFTGKTATISVVMTEYPAEYNDPKSTLYGKLM